MSIREIKVMVGYNQWDILKDVMIIRRFLNLNMHFHSMNYEQDRPNAKEIEEQMNEVVYNLNPIFYMNLAKWTGFKTITSSFISFGFTYILGSFHNLGQLM